MMIVHYPIPFYFICRPCPPLIIFKKSRFLNIASRSSQKRLPQSNSTSLYNLVVFNVYLIAGQNTTILDGYVSRAFVSPIGQGGAGAGAAGRTWMTLFV
jgi:hypothetical protein